MNINSTNYLYSQLQKMELENQKKQHIKIISQDEFERLSDAQKLMYIFWYRDTQTLFVNEKGETEEEYIELPDMDLSGQDLSRERLQINDEQTIIGLKIKRFIIATHDEEGNLKQSNINLSNTNAEINLNNLVPTKIEFNELGTRRFIIDFTNVDFRGCNIYGILPDEYLPEDIGKERLRERIKVEGRENLDERYLQRRQKMHLSKEEKKLADTIYKKIINGENINVARLKSRAMLYDYDLSEVDSKRLDRISQYVIAKYTGIPGEILGYELFSSLSPQVRINILTKELKNNNFAFINKNIKYVDIDFIKKVIQYLIVMGNCNNNKLTNTDREEIRHIIQKGLNMVDEKFFYQMYQQAYNSHNYDFMIENFPKYYTMINMRINRDQKYERIVDIIKKLEKRINSKNISDEEKSKINEFISIISFEKLQGRDQTSLIMYAINKHRFDYIVKYFSFIESKTFMLYDMLNALIKLKESEDIVEEEKKQIEEMINPYIKRIDAKEIPSIGMSGNHNLLSEILPEDNKENSSEEEESSSKEYKRRDFISDSIIDNFGDEDTIKKLKDLYGEELVNEEYDTISKNRETLANFLRNRFQIEDVESYIKKLQHTTLYLKYSIDDDEALDKFEQTKYSLTIRANIFDVFHMAREFFLIKENDPEEKKKISMHKEDAQTLYERLMFFYRYKEQLGISMARKNFVWTLGISSEEFVKKYLSQIHPIETRELCEEGEEYIYTEIYLLGNEFKMPSDFEKICSNIKQVKNSIKIQTKTMKGASR